MLEDPYYRYRQPAPTAPYFDVAQICLNGHVATEAFNREVEHRRPYCDQCGEPTVTKCPSCSTDIEGRHSQSCWGEFKAKNYCKHCGAPFPWTTRTIQGALDLFALEIEDEQRRKQFAEDLATISKDSPQADAAGFRLKTAISGMKQVGGSLKKIAESLATEALKKAWFS